MPRQAHTRSARPAGCRAGVRGRLAMVTGVALLLAPLSLAAQAGGGRGVSPARAPAPAAAARQESAREELRQLEEQRVALEQATQELMREIENRRDIDAPLRDSLMRLRVRELQVRARSLAVARGLQPEQNARVRVMQQRSGPRGWLGVSFEGGLVEETPRGAVLVAPSYPQIFTVSPGSPAEVAGLARGDRIVSIGGVDVRAEPIVLDEVFQPGRTVPLRIVRDGRTREVRVRVTPRPQRWMALRAVPDSALIAGLPDWTTPWTLELDSNDDWSGMFRFRLDSANMSSVRMQLESALTAAAGRWEPDVVVRRTAPTAPRAVPEATQVRVRVRNTEELNAATPFVMRMDDVGYAFGARLTTLSTMLRGELNAPDGGILVLDVASATPAERAGLRPLDVIVRAAGTPVLTPAALVRLIGEQKGKELPLQLVRRGQVERVVVAW